MKEIEAVSGLSTAAERYGDDTELLSGISDRLEQDMLRYDKPISAEEEFNEY